MAQFELWGAVYPEKLNQGWGRLDPATYSQFGFTRHNGRDLAIGEDSLVRAPFDGTIVRNGFQPNGGGIYLGIVSDDAYEFPDFTCTTPDNASISFKAGTFHVLADYLHLKSISAAEGQKVKVGDILAVQDSTGFSTGPHTHEQMRRVTWDGILFTFVDVNDANGSFDPTQFKNGFYSKDAQKTISLYQQIIQILTNILKRPKN